MHKLRTLLFSAKLRKLTHLRAKIRNQTKWSSSFDMVLRYVQIRQYLPELNSSDVDQVCLALTQNRRLDGLIDRLKVL